MRHWSALALLALVLVVATTAVAEPVPAVRGAKAKKCFKRKHGKRVRVKCKKKAPPKQPASPAPTPGPPSPPPPDPAYKQQSIAALRGQMLHHFSTSAGAGGFQGDEILQMCSDGRYKYLAQLYMVPGGLLGAITDEAGTWQVTGAEPGANGTTIAGLLLLPGDGTPPHFVRLTLVPTLDGWNAYIADARWYLGPSTLCS
jgi:hypothetical protein